MIKESKRKIAIIAVASSGYEVILIARDLDSGIIGKHHLFRIL